MREESDGGIPIPPLFDACPTEALLAMVVEMLERLIHHNDRIAIAQTNLTRFHSRAVPGISVGDYVRRIIKYASIEKSVLPLILIYIDRVCEIHKTFTISSLTCHRFLIAGHHGRQQVGGLTLQELNVLEMEFCAMISWRLATNRELLQSYYVNLVRTSSNYYIAIEDPSKHLPSGS
ncbi:hypothetical protein DFJ73DRAFT_780306 [Zopfochytrium polystomum]|nr:hypothetical protein DFJ73DRAFT_780306 [Zopfochytrium polystomum]